ncbi:conserved exported hypothetical protein [Flavobacterium sp. 9AF]|uniref:T9SS type A sorting domain-containing protein n=1 Tax=Flavobacterium sp. 9AF TaxID=2653142 RepID=UPI0012EFA348|nr:T9SS type A sorting domain-containing protein [Flavobacterium sp. 9AF]VXB04895.1 conserved exported hypothetical protein [Flavobacterium sp. 9AF]
MKNLFTLIVFLLWNISNSQFITNGNLNSTCQGDGYNPVPSCVQGWQASHGTPSVTGTVGNDTAAWMWSYSNTGEGIFTNYNFQAGKTYEVTFKIKTSTKNSNATSAVLNSLAIVKAVSGLTTSSSTTIPSPLATGELIWQRTIGTNINNEETITVCFTPTKNNSQLCFYPLMTASSSSNGYNQVQMEVDDIYITPPVTSVFHFQDSNNIIKNDFCANETIFLNGGASANETQYFLDVWRRPIGSTGAFQWQAQKGSNGWTQGQLGILNLTSIFNAQGYTFSSGYEYQIKVATARPNCTSWVPTTHEFRVLNSTGSPQFTYTSTCATNGTISVTVTATDTSAGLNHWWGLMETSVLGSTTDTNTIGQVGGIQNGTSTTFSGLTRDKFYYIKHGIYNDCLPWTEMRIALPQDVYWSNYTTNFEFINLSSNGSSLSVTVEAHSNPVFVNHHWSISYAPNGSTTGNNPVPGNPSICCSSAPATFNNGLTVNTWYYIKHGIWNDCAPWNETRKAFRIYIQGKLANGNPDYAIETLDIKDTEPFPYEKKTSVKANEFLMYPNPIQKGTTCSVSIDSKTIKELVLVDLLGKSETITFEEKDVNTITFSVPENKSKGIYMVKIITKNDNLLTQKLVIE